MELLKYVNTCFNAENVLSDVAEIIGTVR